MVKRYLPTRPSRFRGVFLVGLIICLYLLDNQSIASRLGGQFFFPYLKSLLWLGLAGVVWIFPRINSRAKLRHHEFINWWALNFAIFYIVAMIAGGFIDGFGKSPYDVSIKGIIINLALIGSVLIGTEFVRSYLTKSFVAKESYLKFLIISLFMTLLNFSITKYGSLKEFEDIFKFLAQYFLPEFSSNLFATYLVYLGGALPAIIYMGMLQAFHWFSPILPNLKWITTALIGILCPIFSLMVMQNVYLIEAKVLKRKGEDKEGPLGWILTSIASIAIIWFAVGVFSVYPSVVATGSMEPMIKPGDVILVKKLEDLKSINTGDVVQFRRENILISHRVIEILEREGQQVYRTKGDNNSVADSDLVKPEQIKGRIVQVIPKVGWPNLLLKSNSDIDLPEIEF